MGCLKISYQSKITVIDEKQIFVDFGYEKNARTKNNCSNYYSGGMLMPNRNGGESYRFGMNGMERDDEVKGQGNSYTTMYRQYDSRLMRWTSTDPITHPQFSPYSAFDNNPIYFSDPSGADSEKRARRYAKKHKLKDFIVTSGSKGSTSLSWNDETGARGRSFKRSVWESFSHGFMHLDDKFARGARNLGRNISGFFSKAGNKIADSWTNFDSYAGHWVRTTDFVFEIGGNASIGAQANVQANAFGVVNVNVNANVASAELVSGRVDFTELFSNNPEAYSGNYIGDEDGTKITQSIGVTAGLIGKKKLVGADYTRTFRTHGNGVFAETNDWGVYAFLPILQAPNKNTVEQDVLSNMNVLKSPKVNPTKVGKQGEFYGANLSVGAALGLGFSAYIKIGFKK